MNCLFVAKQFRLEVLKEWKLKSVQGCSISLESALIELKILQFSRFETWFQTNKGVSYVLNVDFLLHDIISLAKLVMNENSPIFSCTSDLARRKFRIFASIIACKTLQKCPEDFPNHLGKSTILDKLTLNITEEILRFQTWDFPNIFRLHAAEFWMTYLIWSKWIF